MYSQIMGRVLVAILFVISASAVVFAQRLQTPSIPVRPSAAEICSGNNQCSSQTAIHQRKKILNNEKLCAEALRELEKDNRASVAVKLASCYRY